MTKVVPEAIQTDDLKDVELLKTVEDDDLNELKLQDPMQMLEFLKKNDYAFIDKYDGISKERSFEIMTDLGGQYLRIVYASFSGEFKRLYFFHTVPDLQELVSKYLYASLVSAQINQLAVHEGLNRIKYSKQIQ